ncbi:hypothetical protein GQ53DRAFT_769554 [Thozetella sp. PMI_491]|nr:hypothetical protein GQ53DRAFT_769554 [Thozetella sp. PMI_491]
MSNSAPTLEVRRAKRKEKSRRGVRFACPYSVITPNSHKTTRACHGNGFEEIYRLREHIKRCHPKKEVYQCIKCYACFPTESALQDHRDKPDRDGQGPRSLLPTSAETGDAAVAQWRGIVAYLFPGPDLASINPFVLDPAKIRGLVESPPRFMREKMDQLQAQYAMRHGLDEWHQKTFNAMFWALAPQLIEVCQSADAMVESPTTSLQTFVGSSDDEHASSMDAGERRNEATAQDNCAPTPIQFIDPAILRLPFDDYPEHS